MIRAVEPDRKLWEQAHKPTCDVHPCRMWREVHWHVGCSHKTNVWDRCSSCKAKLAPTSLKEME